MINNPSTSILSNNDLTDRQSKSPLLVLSHYKKQELSKYEKEILVILKRNSVLRYSSSKTFTTQNTLSDLKEKLSLPKETKLYLPDYDDKLDEDDNPKLLVDLGFYSGISVFLSVPDIIHGNSDQVDASTEAPREEDIPKTPKPSSKVQNKSSANQSDEPNNNHLSEINIQPSNENGHSNIDSGLLSNDTTKDNTTLQEKKSSQDNHEKEQTASKPTEVIRSSSSSPVILSETLISEKDSPQKSKDAITNRKFTFIFKGPETINYEIEGISNFQEIFRHYQSTVGKKKHIRFRFRNVLIDPSDTPITINANSTKPNQIEVIKVEPERISFSLVDSKNKYGKMYFKIKVGVKLKKVFESFCTRNNLPLNKVSFYHRNKLIDSYMLSTEAELEDNSLIVAVVKP